MRSPSPPLSAGLCAPLQEHIGPPAKVSLASADTVRRGEPSVVYIVVQIAADVNQAEYTLVPPATLTVPATALAGSYRLRVCAGSTGAVPEADETENCSLAAINSVIP